LAVARIWHIDLAIKKMEQATKKKKLEEEQQQREQNKWHGKITQVAQVKLSGGLGLHFCCVMPGEDLED